MVACFSWCQNFPHPPLNPKTSGPKPFLPLSVSGLPTPKPHPEQPPLGHQVREAPEMSGPTTLTVYPSLTQIKLRTFTGIGKIQASLDSSVTKINRNMLIDYSVLNIS